MSGLRNAFIAIALMSGASANAAAACTSSAANGALGQSTALACDTTGDFNLWARGDTNILGNVWAAGSWSDTAKVALETVLGAYVSNKTFADLAGLVDTKISLAESWGGSHPGFVRSTLIGSEDKGDTIGLPTSVANPAKRFSVANDATNATAVVAMSLLVTNVVHAIADGLDSVTITYEVKLSLYATKAAASGPLASSGSDAGAIEKEISDVIESLGKIGTSASSGSSSVAHTSILDGEIIFRTGAPVPGPVAGAGLPLLLLAAGAGMVRRRRAKG